MPGEMANHHFRITEILTVGLIAAETGIKGQIQQSTVNRPKNVVHVFIALVAKDGNTAAKIPNGSTLGGNTVQTAGVLQENMPISNKLVETHAVIVMRSFRVLSTDQPFHSLGRDDLLPAYFAAIGQAAIVGSHIRGSGLHHGAATERRKNVPSIIPDGFAVFTFKEGSNIALCHSLG